MSDRQGAMDDYVGERARELYQDAYFEDDIVDDIMEGKFDDSVHIHIGNMMDAKLKSWNKVAYSKGTKPEVYTYLLGKIEAVDELLSLLKMK
jgi:hypothetical protein